MFRIQQKTELLKEAPRHFVDVLHTYVVRAYGRGGNAVWQLIARNGMNARMNQRIIRVMRTRRE